MGMLKGIRVLELAGFITGPYTGMLLADLGAEVIKVEQPGHGDPFRAWGGSQLSPHFCAYNRNKKSITLDLRSEAGREVFYKLATTADVVIENYRPGVAEKLRVGYEQLSALNPRLVYCSITAFGPDGPLADRPGFDTVAAGTSGFLSLLASDTDPAPRGPAMCDAVTGLTAAYGVLAALVQRERTGKGCHIATSLLQSTLSFLAEPFSYLFAHGTAPGVYTRAKASQAYIFWCRDSKRLAVHLSSPQKFWEALARCLGRPDLLSDDRFKDYPSRIRHYDDIHRTLAPVFLEAPRDYWLERLAAYDVPATPVYTLEEVLHNSQVQHLHLIGSTYHPVFGELRTVANPLRVDNQPVNRAEPPPALGEHTAAVLAELGYSETDMAVLRRAGVIGGEPFPRGRNEGGD